MGGQGETLRSGETQGSRPAESGERGRSDLPRLPADRESDQDERVRRTAYAALRKIPVWIGNLSDSAASSALSSYGAIRGTIQSERQKGDEAHSRC